MSPYVEIKRSPVENRLNALRATILKRAQNYFSVLLKNYRSDVIFFDEDWEKHLLISLKPEITQDFIPSIKSEILKHGHFNLALTPQGEIKVRILEEQIDSFKTSFKSVPSAVTLLPSSAPVALPQPHTASKKPEVLNQPQNGAIIKELKPVNQPVNQNPMAGKKTLEKLQEEVRSLLHEKNMTKSYVSIVCNEIKQTVAINSRSEETAKQMETLLKKTFDFVELKDGKKTVHIGLEAIVAKAKKSGGKTSDTGKTADGKKENRVKKTRKNQKTEASESQGFDAIGEQLAQLADSFEEIKKQFPKKGEELFAHIIEKYGKNAQLLVRTISGSEEKLISVSKNDFASLFAEVFK